MTIIKKNYLVWEELLKAIHGAENEILFQVYYIDNDESWSTFAEALILKSKEGVKVTCLFDALGSRSVCDSDSEKVLRDSGVEIIYFNWLTPWSPKNKSLWFFRNHKRSLIIDKKILFAGGWCIGQKTANWIEASIQVIDPLVVQSAIDDFHHMYSYAHKINMNMPGEKRYAYNQNILDSYIYQAPLLKSRYLAYNYVQFIKSATKNIILIVPYFAPTHKILREIIRARKRGVSVSLLMPTKTDHRFVDTGARTFFHRLLKHGVKIFLSSEMVHAKVSLFDDVAYIGTFNLDPASIRFNFENGVVSQRTEVVSDILQEFENLKKESHEVTADEWNKRKWSQKMFERFVRLFRGML